MDKVWRWFNGKKRSLALVYWSVVIPALPVVYPTGVPDDVNKIVVVLGIALSALGVGHSVVKDNKK
jgi:hypothetical protein